MAVFTNVPNSVLDPGDPIRSVDIIAIKENTNWAHEKLNQGDVNVQTFNASGTWTKPTINGNIAGRFARIQVWAGGGGAGRGPNNSSASGGGGGGYNEIVVPLSTLGATVTVTIGAGGVGRTGSTGFGTAGGQTSFGSHCTAYGGGGGAGNTDSSGGGGGQLSAGATGSNGDIGRPRTGFRAASSSGYGTVFGFHGFTFHGGTSLNGSPGDALYGGGAGSVGYAERRGLSVYGGAGGARNNVGEQPGGGGGASSSNNGNGRNGAAGRVIVTVY
jgi:hypothetical protein